MTAKIIRLDIVDDDFDARYCNDRVLRTYYLVNPSEIKLDALKRTIEGRFDTFGLTDEEIEAREKFCDFIWDEVDKFITENFIVLDINETYEISY